MQRKHFEPEHEAFAQSFRTFAEKELVPHYLEWERAGITPLQYRRLCQQFPAIRYTPNFLPLEQETFLQFIS